MLQYDKTKPLFSLHIPKCGGTSFNKLLRRWFLLGYARHYYNQKTGKFPRKHTLHYKASGILPVCIHGHFDNRNNTELFNYYNEASQFITMLRNPLEIKVSMYNYILKSVENGSFYQKGQKVNEFNMSVDDFVLNTEFVMKHFLPWKLTMENYKQVIHENFIHIGVMEELQQSVNVLADKLNKSPMEMPKVNVSGSKIQPEKETIKLFKEKYPVEHAIYDYALEMNR